MKQNTNCGLLRAAFPQLGNDVFSNFSVNGQQFLQSFEVGEKKLHCEWLWITMISVLHTGVVKVTPSLPAWSTLPWIRVSTLGSNWVSSDLEEKIFVDFILWEKNFFWLKRNKSAIMFVLWYSVVSDAHTCFRNRSRVGTAEKIVNFLWLPDVERAHRQIALSIY